MKRWYLILLSVQCRTGLVPTKSSFLLSRRRSSTCQRARLSSLISPVNQSVFQGISFCFYSEGEIRIDIANLFGFFADIRQEPLMQDFCNGRFVVSGVVNYLPPDEVDRTADDAPSRSSDHGAALQSCSRKTEEAKPFFVADDDAPDGLADFRQRSEIMMLLHQLLESCFFFRFYWTDDNLF